MVRQFEIMRWTLEKKNYQENKVERWKSFVRSFCRTPYCTVCKPIECLSYTMSYLLSIYEFHWFRYMFYDLCFLPLAFLAVTYAFIFLLLTHSFSVAFSNVFFIFASKSNQEENKVLCNVRWYYDLSPNASSPNASLPNQVRLMTSSPNKKFAQWQVRLIKIA